MLLLEKYRPDSVDSSLFGMPSLFHPNIIDQLTYFASSDEMPHLIIAGQQCAGKKTILHFLLEALFSGHAKKTRKQAYKVASSSSKITVLIEQSDYHIIIEATSTNRDRYILLEVVSTYASYRSFGSLPGERSFKMIVINNAHLLTSNSQSILRGIMEEYSDIYRFVLICNNLSKIMEPVRSRAAVFRVPMPDVKQVDNVIRSIVYQEQIQLTPAQREDVLTHSDGKFSEAMWKLQAIQDQFYRGGETERLGQMVENVVSWLGSRVSWNVKANKINDREYRIAATTNITGKPTAMLNQIVLSMLREASYHSVEMYYLEKKGVHHFRICVPEQSGSSNVCFRTSGALDCLVSVICLSNLVASLPQLCYTIRQSIYPILITVTDASMVIEQLMVKLTSRIHDTDLAIAISSLAEQAEYRQCSGHRQIAIHIDSFVIGVIKLIVASEKYY